VKGKIEHIHPALLRILKDLEDDMDMELTITSGKRDAEHNEEVGGVLNSEHTYELAEGVDILCKQGITRFKILKWLFRYDIRRIGIGEDFIHIGIADDKPQYVVWHYYPKKEA
jgi:uncharacterized protein YcbK (DUF882 family)